MSGVIVCCCGRGENMVRSCRTIVLNDKALLGGGRGSEAGGDVASKSPNERLGDASTADCEGVVVVVVVGSKLPVLFCGRPQADRSKTEAGGGYVGSYAIKPFIMSMSIEGSVVGGVGSCCTSVGH